MQKFKKAAIRTIKRKNGLWVAFKEGCKGLSQAKDKAAAKLLFEIGFFNIKD